jgi:AcrR family transcriptional regulator
MHIRRDKFTYWYSYLVETRQTSAMPSSVHPKAVRTTTPASRTTGRPTKENTQRLSEDLREAALALFLERGYGGATLEAIAHAAGTTKPSLYVRFPDKESLFIGVVQWALGQPDWPVPETKPPDLDDLEGALRFLADSALRRATHPSMVGLTRIVVAQADRFPDLAQETFAASLPHAQLVVEVLQRHSAKGAIVADDPDVLAEQFLDLVSARAARLASFGVDRNAAAQRRYTDVAVKLFLRGLRPG